MRRKAKDHKEAFLCRKSATTLAVFTIALMAADPISGYAQNATGSEKRALAQTDAENLKRLDAERLEKRKTLERIADDLERAYLREEDIREEIAALDKDMASLNEALIRSASKAQTLEEQLSATEQRINTLENNAAKMKDRLRDRQAMVAQLISAMLRLGRTPPPAIAIAPEDALGSVRSAIILGRLFPEIRQEAEILAQDLERLDQTKLALEQEINNLVQENQRLEEERQRTALLLEERQILRGQNQETLDEQEQTIQALAADATSLQELIGEMEREIKIVREAAEASRLAQQKRDQDEKNLQDRLADNARIVPALNFDEARGLLPLPVRGILTKNYSDDDHQGGRTKGQSFSARSGAQIIAPADGWVVYSGPFRSFGQLLILDVGEDYHIVMAGMGTLNVSLGQFVLLGEPIGEMGGRLLANAQTQSIIDGNRETALDNVIKAPQPLLYVEFRKNGQAIDPSPWWSDRFEKRIDG